MQALIEFIISHMDKKRENKHERFVHLAEARMKKVLLAMRSLGNLSNKQNYDYSIDEANQMIKHLKNELNELESLFLKDRNKIDFKFKKRILDD